MTDSDKKHIINNLVNNLYTTHPAFDGCFKVLGENYLDIMVERSNAYIPIDQDMGLSRLWYSVFLESCVGETETYEDEGVGIDMLSSFGDISDIQNFFQTDMMYYGGFVSDLMHRFSGSFLLEVVDNCDKLFPYYEKLALYNGFDLIMKNHILTKDTKSCIQSIVNVLETS